MAILGDQSGYPILKGASGVTDLFIGGDVNNVQILTAHLLPGADSNRDLGSPTRRWQDGFFTNIHGTTLISGSATSTGSFGHGFIDGKLGINTTAPVDRFHIVGTIRAQDGSSANDYVRVFHDGTDGQLLSLIHI